MNKRQKPSKSRRGAGITLAVCFVAAAVMVGTYTLRNYQEARQQEQALAEENARTKEKESQEEAGSSLVINTEEDPADGAEQETQGSSMEDAAGESADSQSGAEAVPQGSASGTGASSQTSGGAGNVNFSGESILLWPVDGNVIMNYSMDKTVYFSTLDQYKYNPALVIQSDVNTKVLAAADGQVLSVETTPETGETVAVDIGGGYQLVYGQLKEIQFAVGDRVSRGDLLGFVSEPTKYYSVEGSNLYFQMLKDGEPVNPMDYLQ